mgnify:CR=1 FL=1
MDHAAEAPTSIKPATRPSPVRVKKLGHIVLQVRNLEQSVRFYTEVLNFRVSDNATVGGIFLLTLLIVSIITVRISDMILDSRVGALDRTLGFLFGLGRGLIIVVVAFLFFAWLVPDRVERK